MSLRNRIERVKRIIAIADAKARVENPNGLSSKDKLRIGVAASLSTVLSRE